MPLALNWIFADYPVFWRLTPGSNNTLYSTAHLHLFVVRVPKLYSTKYKFQNSLVFSLDCHRGTSAASHSLVHLAHGILDRNQHPVIIEHPRSQFTNITRQLLPSRLPVIRVVQRRCQWPGIYLTSCFMISLLLNIFSSWSVPVRLALYQYLSSLSQLPCSRNSVH